MNLLYELIFPPKPKAKFQLDVDSQTSTEGKEAAE